MSTSVSVKWIKGMAFEAEVTGHKIMLDADVAAGGEDLGPRPKALVLGSLGGCTGMDVVSVLKKMRVEPEGFEMVIEGDLTETHPKYYHTIRLHYIFYGKNLPYDKLETAIKLSQDKYCGVSAMLKGVAKIEFTIEVKEAP
ncbi:MAG: OsmC family protein [Bacteroidetes bacterium]|nr:OsmC family protein [Bacteroidota bacterium]